MKGDLINGLKGRLLSVKSNVNREKCILICVLIAATVIRSIPGWLNAAWGSDFGIYYGITKDFAENPQLFRAYEGWGASYNYFPVLYVLVTFLHYITGIEIVWLLPRVAPVFGGLSVLVFYFVAEEIVGNKKIALLSTAFLAVNPFHIYQTSHAAPMTMGHFFMILGLYFFIKKNKNIASFVVLSICSVLLVASHHLTTFFYIITIIFITFYRNLISDKWTENLKWDVGYIILFSTYTFLYWVLIATPVYRDFIRGGLLIPSWVVIGLFYAGILFLFLTVILRRRFFPVTGIVKDKKPNLQILMISALIICSSFVVIFSFIEIPHTGFTFEKTAIFFLLPLITAVGFGFYGAFIINMKPEKGYVFGWLYPIFISLILTTITWHRALLPFRHLEYIAYPLSIISGVGAFTYWRKLTENEPEEMPGKKKITSKTFGNIVAVVLVLNLISAYSVQHVTSRYEESISEEVFDVIDWMKGNVTGYNFTIASDHRISQILWAEGYNVTSDDAYVIWFSEDWTESLEELETANGTRPRIDLVVIDHVMRFDGVQSNINETPRNLSDESYGKFMHPPFSMIYRSQNKNGEKWAELYEIDWDYIGANRP